MNLSNQAFSDPSPKWNHLMESCLQDLNISHRLPSFIAWLTLLCLDFQIQFQHQGMIEGIVVITFKQQILNKNLNKSSKDAELLHWSWRSSILPWP